MELLDERAPEVMTADELVCALDQADLDLAQIQTRRLHLIAALDKTGHAEQVGARDTVQFIEYRHRLDHHRARRDVLLARALPKYPAVSAALPATATKDNPPVVALRPAQAEAIVLELEKLPATVQLADLDVAEQELVRLARHLAPADLRKAAEQARNILDTDGPEPEEHQAAARETLTLTNADRGVKFRGYLANENAELLRTLITAGARPHKTLTGDPDPRTPEKRRADALSTTLTLAATALDAGTPSPTIPRPATPPPTTVNNAPSNPTDDAHGNTRGDADANRHGNARDDAAAGPAPDTRDGSAGRGTDGSGSSGDRSGGSGTGEAGGRGDVVPGFGAKANITVTIDLNDLKAATADAIGDTVYGNGLSAATIRRLACDAKVIPIVLGSNSEPLDVGRCERLVTRAIRRALNTRDKGCVVCGAPPVMCDAHHLISWIDGGETKIDNLALLCRRHHTDFHNGHWTITITNGAVHVTRPSWADPPPVYPHKPPASPSDAPDPPGEEPTRPNPPDGPGKQPAGPDSPDRTSARPRPTAGEVASTGNLSRPTAETESESVRRSLEPAPGTGSPWNGTDLPAATGTRGRSSRWHADNATYAEAIQFAVCGAVTPNDSGADPPTFATI